MGERIGLVGIIDDAERAVDLADLLQPPRHALEDLEALEHLGRPALAFDREHEAGGDESVLDLESAEQRQSASRIVVPKASTVSAWPKAFRARFDEAQASRPCCRW